MRALATSWKREFYAAKQTELGLLAKELAGGRGLARLKKLLAASHPTEARIVK